MPMGNDSLGVAPAPRFALSWFFGGEESCGVLFAGGFCMNSLVVRPTSSLMSSRSWRIAVMVIVLPSTDNLGDAPLRSGLSRLLIAAATFVARPGSPAIVKTLVSIGVTDKNFCGCTAVA